MAFYKEQGKKKFWILEMMGKNLFDGVLEGHIDVLKPKKEFKLR